MQKRKNRKKINDLKTLSIAIMPLALFNTSHFDTSKTVYKEKVIVTTSQPVKAIALAPTKVQFFKRYYNNENFKLRITKLVNQSTLSERPNKVSIANSFAILDILSSKSLSPTFVNLSQEQSIIIELLEGDNYFLFETFDDGEMVFLKRNNVTKERVAFDLTKESLKTTINSIL